MPWCTPSFARLYGFVTRWWLIDQFEHYLRMQKHYRHMRQVCTWAAFAIAILLATAFATNAQSVDCPVDKVCISREAAQQALEDSDRRKALEAEVKVKDQAIADFRDALNKMRIEFAEKAGENTALKQNAVSDRAIIDILLKNVKKKCTLSICF